VPARIPSGNQLLYKPAANFVGDDSFAFQADDGGTAPAGGTSNTASITISVENLMGGEYQVSAADDDVMAESPGGAQFPGSTYLRLGQRVIGLRFRGVEIPNGAQIVSAYLQLYAGMTEKSAALVQAQATGNAADFGPDQPGVVTRKRTQASVAWDWQGDEPEDTWTSSPDLQPIIQEIVNRPDWSSGNAIALIYDGKNTLGSGTYFRSWEADPQRAAKLQITYRPASGTMSVP
jgi:hypothetical protein